MARRLLSRLFMFRRIRGNQFSKHKKGTCDNH